jgi:nitroimidazol reductase NimA-like FMN-containing flavoprotein (pyridoxamine 5'-phosphate oxidase superfamily)
MPQGPLQILDIEHCLSLLEPRHLGRVAFLDQGRLSILPINYVLVDGAVTFRTDAGGKLEAALRGDQIAFEIDGTEASGRTGWSVLVRGRAERVMDPAELARLQALPLVSWAPGAKPHYIRIAAAEVTGRRIPAARLPSRWWG